MISTPLARALRDSGLVWHPAAGDAFRIDLVEVDDEVFYLSDMTVEAHTLMTGTELGFNGTTEWALDSVAIEDALWLPSESQLRVLLGSAFRSLTAVDKGSRVTAEIDDIRSDFDADLAEDAYARALIALLDSVTA
ncbi:MAG: hypothetical protein QOH69_2024 [Actinomycetota bacterium]|nr:hypothetical protein [Actinomycetota bacterium]